MTDPKQPQRTPCTIYSRVVGWITPIKNWNKGKQSEYLDRKTYKLPAPDTSAAPH